MKHSRMDKEWFTVGGGRWGVRIEMSAFSMIPRTISTVLWDITLVLGGGIRQWS